MPEALIFNRPVWTAGDPSPNTGGWHTGEDWFNRIEPTSSRATGKTHTIFCNEWQTNDWNTDAMRRFVQFYIELIDACVKRGVPMTIGDWGEGTPGSPSVPGEAHQLQELQPLLSYAEEVNRKYGEKFVVINQHSYAIEGLGATDMSAGALDYTMRWERTIKGHPGLSVWGGEVGNASKGVDGVTRGLFRPETPALQNQYTNMVHASPYNSQYIGGAWWGWLWPEQHSNAGSDWSHDDWSPIMPQYFDHLASLQRF